MDLSFRIHTNIDLVFDHLTDMQKFVSVHPVISQMDNLDDGRYRVHETLKLGFIPFSFKYSATVEKNEKDKRVIIRATVFKLTKIEMQFDLKEDGQYTSVEEKIQFRTFLPVKPIMANVFRKQHDRLFKNIESVEA